MYPFFRMAYEIYLARKAPPLDVGEPHLSYHRCWPWDIDFWMELNNGRTLTLYDLGRIPLAWRTGLVRALRDNGWGLTVAGVSVRYRRRVRTFEKVEMHSRIVGWDARFFYIDQSIWKSDGECAGQALYRIAVTTPQGILPVERVMQELQFTHAPSLPDWIANWIAAEGSRPWPPENAHEHTRAGGAANRT